MINKFALILSLLISPYIFSQPAIMPKEEAQTSVSKVEGLELPADQTVNFDEGFITIEAKTKGEVRWLVLSQGKIKYTPISPTALIVGVPPQDGTVISVFAIAIIDGKPTEFVNTNITVKGNGKPEPAVRPAERGAPPQGGGGPYHFTFLVNMNALPPELGQALNSASLRQNVTGKGNFLRVYDLNNPIVTQRRLDQVVQRVGGNAILVVQRGDGTVITAQPAPRTEAEILEFTNRFNGN